METNNLILMNERIHKQTRSVRDVVYEIIKQGILSEQFVANTQLKERELSEQFGVSTTPIKEAMRRLELEGLVVTIPRKGTYVSGQVMKSVEEITFARSALEGVAAGLTASKITKKESEKLEQIINQMKAFTLEKNREGLIKSNDLFHQLIIRSAKNDYIEMQITSLKAFADFVRKQALADMDELERAFQEHYLIFTKIVSGDSNGAEEAMRNHIRRTVLSYQGKELNQQPEKN